MSDSDQRGTWFEFHSLHFTNLSHTMLGSSYMNATLVDSYLKRGAHIITQAPMEDTVVDFWRMVWDKKVCVIANLLTDKEIDEVRFCRFSCILY